jgi:hypothetical protein
MRFLFLFSWIFALLASCALALKNLLQEPPVPGQVVMIEDQRTVAEFLYV